MKTQLIETHRIQSERIGNIYYRSKITPIQKQMQYAELSALNGVLAETVNLEARSAGQSRKYFYDEFR